MTSRGGEGVEVVKEYNIPNSFLRPSYYLIAPSITMEEAGAEEVPPVLIKFGSVGLPTKGEAESVLAESTEAPSLQKFRMELIVEQELAAKAIEAYMGRLV
ncbi:uncharacterized protein A4U43_C08F17260 [Asparagus officinalis]|nr:uncharacterized protein A4U43_C08F17260 [Asparagus officinalis]